MAKAAIELEGMRELRRELNRLATDEPWKAGLKTAYKKSADIVQEKARSNAQQRRTNLGGGPARLGSRGVASIQGKATTTMARIDAYKGVPWGPGNEFGASGRLRQFPAKKAGGYNVYPAIESESERITDAFADAVGEELGRAFPE